MGWHSILVKIEQKCLTHNELSLLVEKTSKIAFAYITLKKNTSSIIYYKDSDSLKNLAIDSIVPLFTERNNQIGLEHALKNWKDSIENELDADFFLHKVVWKCVEQEIVVHLKELDPIFTKIHKTLSVCVSRYSLVKKQVFGTTYVFDEETEEVSDLIDPSEFKELPLSLFTKRQYALFDEVFSFLESRGYAKAVPLNSLIHQIKHLHLGQKVEFSEDVAIETENEIFINEILDIAVKNVDDKLKNQYLFKEKITENEYHVYINVFKLIKTDLKNGGLSGGLYKYFLNEIPALTQDEFYNRYHGISRYLYTQMKEHILNYFIV